MKKKQYVTLLLRVAFEGSRVPEQQLSLLETILLGLKLFPPFYHTIAVVFQTHHT